MNSFSKYIENYWKEVKDQYNISFGEFELICKTPFKFVKNIISSGVLKNIRFKYFGVFQVSGSRVKYSKKSLQANYDKRLVSEKHYNKRMNVLNNYEEVD